MALDETLWEALVTASSCLRPPALAPSARRPRSPRRSRRRRSRLRRRRRALREGPAISGHGPRGMRGCSSAGEAAPSGTAAEAAAAADSGPTRRQQWPPPEWRRCGQVGAVARAQGEAEGEEAGRGRRGQATAAEVYDWHPPAAASALRPRLGPPPHMAARREQPPPEATEGSGLVHPLRPSVALLAPELVSRPRRHVDAGRHLRRAHRSAVLGHRLGGRWRREDCGLPPAREPLRGSEAEATVLLPGVAGAGRVPSARRGTVRGPETFGAARPWCTPLVYGPSGCRMMRCDPGLLEGLRGGRQAGAVRDWLVFATLFIGTTHAVSALCATLQVPRRAERSVRIALIPLHCMDSLPCRAPGP
ncbi:unnamed protein product [Prorocentrum cordatum]|uniref:Uncharacterized protein n=1 Tax=Prorocentrum cordatum TaxID=2364126 RepID=A0ABN9UER6_9DINO|nr:unnamed protein product [Polarella glacialis]